MTNNLGRMRSFHALMRSQSGFFGGWGGGENRGGIAGLLGNLKLGGPREWVREGV